MMQFYNVILNMRGSGKVKNPRFSWVVVAKNKTNAIGLVVRKLNSYHKKPKFWIDDFIAMELMDPDDYFNEEVLNL